MATAGSNGAATGRSGGLRATDPLVHEFARRLGTVDFESIEGHLQSLEQTADARNFLSLEDTVGGLAVEAATPATSEQEGEQSSGEVGPYVLVRLLGVGGFSRVFEAYHRDRPAERVALKLFQHRWLDALERLEIEKLVLQELRHPNLVRAIDSGETEDGLSYLVLAYVRGQRIDEYVRACKLRPREIALLFAQLADALAYAHDLDVVHRDVKPNNILVTDDGFPVVADFGLAKRLRLPAGKSVTVSGALIGTLGYLAPEQVSGSRGEVTRAVDVYGLGATLYAVLTGRPPTESENFLRGLQQLQHGRPPAPRSLNPEVPLELQLICMKCLEKQPRDRYDSMVELAADLRRFAAGQRVAARAPSVGAQAVRWARANPTFASLVGGILGAVAVGLVVSLLLWQRAESRRLQAEALLRSAHTILKVGNRMAEDSLLQTPGSLEYRYNRLRQSIDFLSGLLTEFPNDSELQYELAVANFLLGKVCARRGWYKESVEKYEIAEAAFRRMSASRPDDLKLKFDLFHSVLGKYQVKGSKDSTGEENVFLVEAHELIQEILAADPENTKYRDAYLCTLLQLPGRLLLQDWQDPLQVYQEAHAEAMQLKSDLPVPCLEWRYAGMTAARIASTLRVMGKPEEALHWIKKALPLQQEFITREGGDPLERLDLIGTRIEEIHSLLAIGDSARARMAWEESMKSLRVWSEQYPDYIDFKRFLDGLALFPLEFPELLTGPARVPDHTID
ncbi:MAG: serine/threonine protein kinase [Planctomycetota bacterium]